MAINVYTPGCHLICHDDVIGSRRVSYILYLTDPDVGWKAEWGGALRLFPTQEFEEDGVKTITPSPDVVKVIPPAWNQLAFFAVQPGESFHDVEEVYRAETEEQLEKEGGRIRMAISGWYHIPQIGEDGYVEGEEEKWGKNSSLKQLQGDPDRYDFPKPQPVVIEVPTDVEKKPDLTMVEQDLDFLLKYMAPTYLVPDTLEEVAEHFTDMSTITLDGLLSKKFAAEVQEYITAQEVAPLPSSSVEIEAGAWKVAKPPHKHRYLYLQPAVSPSQDSSPEYNPIKELLEVFLPSRQFRQWLEIATQCDIQDIDLLARRFRKGLDYQLATSHDGEPRLEISLGLTPTPGWGADTDKDVGEEGEEGEEEEEEEEQEVRLAQATKSRFTPESTPEKKNDQKASAKSKAKEKLPSEEPEEDEVEDMGGHEVYMAADDDDSLAADAAVYKAAGDEATDGVLFTMQPSWNKMSIVLRDSGVLKFVKYVSKSAKGDRWDITGAFSVNIDGDEEGDAENPLAGESEVEDLNEIALGESDEEEVFQGFPDSEDSDSD
jgi:hypothetical protein